MAKMAKKTITLAKTISHKLAEKYDHSIQPTIAASLRLENDTTGQTIVTAMGDGETSEVDK